MAGKSKRVCLIQYLRDGDPRTRRVDLQLSLDDEELNYYICRQNGSATADEDYSLLTDEGQDLDYLAIIHTQDGYVCLEALVPGVAMPLLGRGFDGHTAHDFRVKPTTPGLTQNTILQLRPGEPFYIQSLSFTLVSEEECDEPAQVSSIGVVPSYDEYSQHISQPKIDLQAFYSLSSPPKSGRVASAIPETPKKSNTMDPSCTPLIQQIAGDAMDGREDSQEWPQSPEKRFVLHTMRQLTGSQSQGNGVGALDGLASEAEPTIGTSAIRIPPVVPEVLDLQDEEPAKSETLEPVLPSSPGYQHLVTSHLAKDDTQGSTELRVSGHPEPLLSSPIRPEENGNGPVMSGPIVPSADLPLPSKHAVQSESSDNEDHPQRKRRKLSRDLVHKSAEESQDSLAGKSIEVEPQIKTPAAARNVKARDSIEKPLSKSFSRPSRTTPCTPSINNSTLESPTNSHEPTSSLRSMRSTARDDIHSLNVQDDGIRILFASSTSVDTPAFKKFLLAQGVKIVQKCKDATCLCIGKGELKKTPNLILAVLMGIEIVREDWVTDSARHKELQDVKLYAARDTQREQEWGVSLDEAIERGRQKTRVFQDLNIIITPSAKKELGAKGFADFKEILNAAGAGKVTSVLPKKNPEELSSTLVIGTQADASTPGLKEWNCYTKDLVTSSALRGELCIKGDEFLIQKQSQQPKGNKKRKR